MPLNGSGALMGATILGAIGNPDPNAIPSFAALGDTIAAWTLQNVAVQPGTMVSAGAVVTGAGELKVVGSADDLGAQLSLAMGDPSDGGIAIWQKFARAFVSHLEKYGSVTPALFAAPTPSGGPLTGTGLVAFSNLAISVHEALGVTEVVAAAALDLFGAQILSHIATNALVSPIALVAPFIPFTGPSGGGPIIGGGSIL